MKSACTQNDRHTPPLSIWRSDPVYQKYNQNNFRNNSSRLKKKHFGPSTTKKSSKKSTKKKKVKKEYNYEFSDSDNYMLITPRETYPTEEEEDSFFATRPEEEEYNDEDYEVEEPEESDPEDYIIFSIKKEATEELEGKSNLF